MKFALPFAGLDPLREHELQETSSASLTEVNPSLDGSDSCKSSPRSGKQLWEICRTLYFTRMVWARSLLEENRAIYGQDCSPATCEDDPEPRPPYIFLPDNRWRRWWDLGLALMLTYISLFVPYRLGFDREPEPWDTGFIIDIFVDLYFVCDIAVNFRTAYVEECNRVIVDPRMIAQQYIRSWFPLDLLSSFPANYISIALESNDSANSVRMLKMIRLFRLAKMLRLVRLQRLLMAYEEELGYIIHAMQVTKLVFLIFFIAHLMACFWYFLGDGEETHGHGKVFGWVIRQGWDHDVGDFTRYITSFYWAITTMTTVGYGDITAETHNEMMFAVFSMLVGGFVFGMIVGNVSAVISSANSSSMLLRDRMSAIKEFMRVKHVPVDLQHRVKRFYEWLFFNKTVFDQSEILSALPHSLRADMVRHMYKTIVTKVPLFFGLDDEVVARICLKLQPYHAAAGDVIINQGDVSHELFIIVEGSVTVRRNGVQVLVLKNNSFFGEMGLLGLGDGKERNLSPQTVIAQETSDLCFLNQHDLRQLAEDFSVLKEALLRFAVQRRKRMHRAMTLFGSGTFPDMESDVGTALDTSTQRSITKLQNQMWRSNMVLNDLGGRMERIESAMLALTSAIQGRQVPRLETSRCACCGNCLGEEPGAKHGDHGGCAGGEGGG
eukprot:Rmarinus@m.23699